MPDMQTLAEAKASNDRTTTRSALPPQSVASNLPRMGCRLVHESPLETEGAPCSSLCASVRTRGDLCPPCCLLI